MIELKPCPFCGGNPTAITSEDGFTSVGCLNGHSFFGVMVQGNTEAEAADKWNARHERTCHDVSKSEWCFKCDLCGYEYSAIGGYGCDYGDEPWFDFCPDCGAKVVNE